MEAEDGGIAPARLIVGGLHDEPADLRPVEALERDLFNGAELDLRQPGIILVRESPELATFDGVHLCRLRLSALHHGDLALARHREVGDGDPAVHHPLDRPAARGDPGQVIDAIVLEEEKHRRAVGRPDRGEDLSVERRGQNLRRAAAHRNDGDVLYGVVEQVERTALDVGEALSIRAPGRAAAPPSRVAVSTRIGGDLPRLGARLRFHHVDVVVVGTIGLGPAPAHEGDRAAVGRPRRGDLVVVAWGDELGFPGGDIEKVEVFPAGRDVAGLVLLEAIAVNDDRLRGLRGRIAGHPLIGVGVFGDQRESDAVGRPGVVGDAAGEIGDALRLTAVPVEEPELIGLARIVAAGEKGDVAAIGAPARGVFAGRAPGELDGASTVPARHPDVGVVAVVHRVHGGDGVGDPAAVGGELRIAHIAQRREITDVDGALRLLCVERPRPTHRHDQAQSHDGGSREADDRVEHAGYPVSCSWEGVVLHWGPEPPVGGIYPPTEDRANHSTASKA